LTGTAFAAAPASAGPITFFDASGPLAASVTFEANGADLVVTLTNTSPNDVLVPADVLTSVFFDALGPALGLAPVSAILAPGSVVFFGPVGPGGDVGGEWTYRAGLVGAPLGLPYGISSAGLGLFGPPDAFPGPVLTPPSGPDGLDYGITSAGDNPATGNAPVTGGFPLIHNSVIFTLTGLPPGFDPANSITRVWWQYGTSLSEGGFPEPATIGMLIIGLAAVRRRRPLSA
jgi:hypothetical protein